MKKTSHRLARFAVAATHFETFVRSRSAEQTEFVRGDISSSAFSWTCVHKHVVGVAPSATDGAAKPNGISDLRVGDVRRGLFFSVPKNAPFRDRENSFTGHVPPM